MSKKECENLILRAFEKAKENGFTIAIASDEEANGFNEIQPIQLFFGDTKDNAIVMGVYGFIDENEIMK